MESTEAERTWRDGRMEYQPVFITAAANTVAQAVVWFSIAGQEFVAYAASNSVALVDARRKRVLYTLQLQKDEERVTSVCYAPSPVEGEVCLFAGGGKGYVAMWRLSLNHGALDHSLAFCLSNDGSAISTMHALCLQDHVVLAVADTSGSVRLLQNSELRQSLKFPPAQLPNSVHLARLTSASLLLALGCVDARIHLYVVSDRLTSVGQLAGHEEWITCMTTIRSPDALSSSDVADFPLLLASGSQDNKIRIWRLTSTPLSMELRETKEEQELTLVQGVEVEQEEGEEEDEEGEEGGDKGGDRLVHEDDRHARLSFSSGTHNHSVHLDALLVGHEDWITSLHWMPQHWPPVLFSASMDRNLVLWKENEIWTPSVRVGDLGGALGGSIGGNLLGFVSAAPAPTASPSRFLAIGYGGACHLWTCLSSKSTEGGGGGGDEDRWGTEVGYWSGHFASVQDLAWQDHGDFLVTVSLDQTCRVFARALACHQWREVSRPQIHGYDLHCLLLGPWGVQVWTGGEEKLIRVLEMPGGVRHGLASLCGIDLSAAQPARVEQAYIPELGLSNKGREMMTKQERQEAEQRGVQGMDWKSPPLESQLADLTLWLETQKLFGHNNSVLALAVSLDRKYMASSSRARYGAQCVLMLWKQRSLPSSSSSSSSEGEEASRGEDVVYDALGLLPGHESTVVCLSFSSCSKRLATAGKDRRLCIYAQQGNRFEHVVVLANAHKRIIWDLSWCPSTSEMEYHLVTASRDGACKLWRLTCEHALDCLLTFSPFEGRAVTAVSVLPRAGPTWTLAVGSEAGEMGVWTISLGEAIQAQCVGNIPAQFAHSRSVRRIQWRPKHVGEEEEQSVVELATCSEDHSVRIHRIRLTP